MRKIDFKDKKSIEEIKRHLEKKEEMEIFLLDRIVNLKESDELYTNESFTTVVYIGNYFRKNTIIIHSESDEKLGEVLELIKGRKLSIMAAYDTVSTLYLMAGKKSIPSKYYLFMQDTRHLDIVETKNLSFEPAKYYDGLDAMIKRSFKESQRYFVKKGIFGLSKSDAVNMMDDDFYYIRDGSKIIGIMSKKLRDLRYMELYNVWIKPEYRRKGYFRSTLSLLDKEARDEGHKVIALVRFDDFAFIKNLERHDFNLIGVYSIDEI